MKKKEIVLKIAEQIESSLGPIITLKHLTDVAYSFQLSEELAPAGITNKDIYNQLKKKFYSLNSFEHYINYTTNIQ